MADRYLAFRAEDVRWRGANGATFSAPLTPDQAVDDAIVLAPDQLTDADRAWQRAAQVMTQAVECAEPVLAAAWRDLADYLAAVATRLEEGR